MEVSQLLTPDNNAKVKRSKYCRVVTIIATICSLLLIITLCVIYIPASSSSSNSSSATNQLTGNGNVFRNVLTYDVLMGNTNAPSSYVDYSAMELPADAAEPDIEFSGTLSISLSSQIGFETVVDWYNYGNNAARRRIPPITVDIVQDGSHIIPSIRYNTRTNHPYWEYILSSGRVWKEADDHDMMRAAIPFTITQKNSQCAHNGVFMFLFSNANGGTISNVWHQITQETCLYFKANYWGLISNVGYVFGTVSGSSTIKQEYQNEIDNRIPTKPIAEISNDYPGIDYAAFASTRDGLVQEHITMNGVYYNGVNYVGSYPTRSGQFPYPEQLIGPSYSTGKSAFLGIAAMYLEHKYGGIFGSNDILDIGYSGSGSNRWTDVTYDNCVDMTTGNYWSANWMTDEGLLAVENGFFLPETHSAKYNHATTYYNRRVSPGNTWVYHSSDHYLCGFGLKRFLRTQSGDNSADIHDEIYANVYKPLHCSEVLKETKRTYDSEYQPFSSHGLFFNRDDIVKIANFVNINHGRIGLQQVLDLHQIRSAMQLTNDKGMNIGRADDAENNQWWYNNGFWSARKLWTRRQCAVDIPLMRGYGGIHVSMYPNGATYYFFGDNDDKDWLVAADEINNLDSFC